MIVKEAKVLSVAPAHLGKAHPIAVLAPHFGAFLNIRPCGSLGTQLHNSSLCFAIALRHSTPTAYLIAVFMKQQLLVMRDMDSAVNL